MKIDRRITNGLAWAGVFLVIGVPTADLLSAQFSGEGAAPTPQQVAVVSEIAPMPAPLSQRPTATVAKPVTEVAVVTPARPVATKSAVPAIQTGVVGDGFVNSGKALPSYITGGGAVPAPAQVAATPPVRTPIVTTPAAPAVDPIQVSAIAPQKIAPMPMPLSMRPTPITVPIAAATARGAIVLPPELIQPPAATVTAADLDDWETGPLSEFLARKQRQGGSSATVASDYDANGFFLDEGPNPRRRDRVIGWDEPEPPFFAD